MSKERLIKAPPALRNLLAFGVYNSVFFSCSAVLFLCWCLSVVLWLFLQITSPCACDSIPTIMFIDYFFPQEIHKSYFLWWVYTFASGVLAESYIMAQLVLKSESVHKSTFVFASVFLAFVHNLPSAFVILTLMAQKEYVFFYVIGGMFSIPLFYTYSTFAGLR